MKKILTLLTFCRICNFVVLVVVRDIIRHNREHDSLEGLARLARLARRDLGSEFHFDAGEHLLLRSLLARGCFVHHKEPGYTDFAPVGLLDCDPRDCFRGGGSGGR